MSLQFILGGSGSGKSTYLYRMISKQAAEHREQKYFILVPDQFTLETQKTMVEMSGKNGILNVDVLSFHRLAYRVFEEIPVLQKTVLEDMGKMMLLRNVFSEQKKNLKYFKRGLHKPGFLDECKSFLSELLQYAVSEEDFEQMEKSLEKESLMCMKIQDLRLIYHEFKEKMGDTYMTAEELVPQLTSVAASIGMLQGSVICLDGFTGFTPTQYDLLTELLACCDRMYVTVTSDRTEKRRRVFSLSTNTIRRLSEIAAEVHTTIEAPVFTGKGKEKIPYRLAKNEELAFLEKSLFAYGRTQWDKVPQNLSVTLCHKESSEAAFVARKIWWLVHREGYSYDEIAVVTSDIAAYEQSLSREMNRMGIRFFMDYKKSIGANAMAEYIMAWMEMIRKGFDYESTFRFLRGGLSPLTVSETDILENYVVAQGRRGYRSYQSEWKYKVDRIDLVLVNDYREKFAASISETMKALRGGKKTVAEFTKILYTQITNSHLYEKIMEKSRAFEEKGEPILAHEYKSIYRLMMNLFDELVTLLGTETVTFQEYEELLSAGISEGLVGFVPPTGNQVMVGDVERSRLKNIKILFFVGVTDERIPKGQGTPGILSEQERRKISEGGTVLAPSNEERSYTEQFYLYLTLTKASDRLYLTYSKVGEDGSSKRPAYLIARLFSMYPKLSLQEDELISTAEQMVGTDKGKRYLISCLSEGTFGDNPRWWELAAYYKRTEPEFYNHVLEERTGRRGRTKLSKKAAEMIYGDKLYGSVTRLEQFAKCPYAHFIIFGLKLRDREQYEVSAFDYGNVFHSAMEHFSHRLEEKEMDWFDLDEEEIPALAEECVDFVTEHYKGEMFHQNKRVEFMILRMKRVLTNTIWGIWRQMSGGDFVQRYSEKRFSGEDGLSALNIDLENQKKLVLNGQIDRVDVCEDKNKELIKIIDYKSGSNVLELDRVYYGLQLQLVTYMAAAIELEEKEHPGKKAIPAAMLYYQMKEPELSWMAESETGHEERVLSEMRCEGYVNDDAEIVEKVDTNMAGEGKFLPESTSQIVPLKVKKDGSLASSSKVLSTEAFENLMKHTREKMKEFGNEIFDGEIEPAPYRKRRECGCTYCELQSVCGKEQKEMAAIARELPELSEDDLWGLLYGRD